MTDRIRNQVAAGIASLRAMAEAGFEAIAEAKASGPQVRVFSDEASAQPLADRRIRYVWSTEAVDRMGDIVRQNWDLGPFTRNPVALYNHNHDQLIGRALDFGVEFGKRKQLVGTIEFAPEGADPLIDSRYKLAAAGFLPATSVGFLPSKVDPVRDKAKREQLGLGEYGVVFESNQLLEISVVSVPANPEAVATGLRECVARGVLTADEAEYVANDTPTERDWFRRLERMAVARVDARPTLNDDAIDRIIERIDQLEFAIRESRTNTLPQGDAQGVAASDHPGSGRGWDIAEVLELLAEGVSRELGTSSQTQEVSHG